MAGHLTSSTMMENLIKNSLKSNLKFSKASSTTTGFKHMISKDTGTSSDVILQYAIVKEKIHAIQDFIQQEYLLRKNFNDLNILKQKFIFP